MMALYPIMKDDFMIRIDEGKNLKVEISSYLKDETGGSPVLDL